MRWRGRKDENEITLCTLHHQKQRNIFSTMMTVTEIFASHENRIIIKENTENSFYTQQ